MAINMRHVHLTTLRGALSLELKGLQRSRGPSAYSIAKKTYGLRGNRESVYTQVCELLEKERAK
jgi:hypothetical protein